MKGSASWKFLYEDTAGRDFARLVERCGWRLLRISGSHHIYGKPGTVVRLSIPIHGNRPLKTGLLGHLAKLAEISAEELE
jgi:predicted RNA binding protein YcfA (HicA-like mRNA interferase family)